LAIELVPFLKMHYQDLKDFFNSVFFTAIAGSLAGAFAGAYAAQRIAEKGKSRDELLKEIRNTNAAIMVAFGICNTLLALKKQHIKKLKENYDAQKADLLAFHEKRRSGQIDKDSVFNIQVDFQHLSQSQFPSDILQNQVFEKMSVGGRPLSLVTTLSQTVHSLNLFLEKRNQLIDTYKASAPIPTEILVPLYFGLPSKGGHVNEEYPNALTAIYDLTDDGIFFSQLLCKDLTGHGENLASKFKELFGDGAPTINRPDFAKADCLGLMPKAENYDDWVSSFVKKEAA